ncbi:receptor-like protein 43 [Pistacia vera]|uniref:receptor-like protein 43 n=1 Tax=Pistacia vera TaxID=55513 RepID=UPI001263E45A|nr:receptor-like protein 43 [Pistacia vera]
MNSALTTLNLNANQLEGTLPQSLAKCNSLEVLDVGNNRINDTFPYWLATLPKLQVLMLRSNSFHGPIRNLNTRCPFPMLRILDLSHNRFIGNLPTSYLKKFKAMMNRDNSSGAAQYMGSHGQYYSTVLTVKGIDVEMVRILTILTIIDLSNNQFQGRIPDIVGKLNSLFFLNFSHNSLTGHIPSSFGNLLELEALDLSSNKLTTNLRDLYLKESNLIHFKMILI